MLCADYANTIRVIRSVKADPDVGSALWYNGGDCVRGLLGLILPVVSSLTVCDVRDIRPQQHVIAAGEISRHKEEQLSNDS